MFNKKNKKNKLINTEIKDNITTALSYDFSRFDKIELVPISDIHVGSCNFIEKRFIQMRNYILEEPNRFTILNGDLVNFAIQQMDGGKDEMTRDEQIYKVSELLKPLADHNRILSDTDGNHEKRMSRKDFYASKAIARNLGILHLYREPGNYLRFQIGKNGHGRPSSYFMYHTHGSGGGRTTGSHTEALKRLGVGKEGVDLFISSHFHEAKAFPVKKHFIDRNTCKLTEREEYYACTGAFLGYEEYAERSCMSPNSDAHVFITMFGKKKQISIEIKSL
jgi:hypothetical protein